MLHFVSKLQRSLQQLPGGIEIGGSGETGG